jgi:regulation of enolase protein 1 (concanavalin A-like superfamily)
MFRIPEKFLALRIQMTSPAIFSSLRMRFSHICERFFLPAFTFLFGSSVFGQVNVTTWRNDNARTGQYLNESVLSPSNVNSNTFGKLFSYGVDGNVYAQPLYVANVSIAGKGTHNVIYVATEHNSVYAFDADSNAGVNATPLWAVNLGSSAAVPNNDFGNRYGPFHAITPEVGITGTPVIDVNSRTLYVDAFTHEGASYFHRLHALDITSGAEKFGGPKQVSASVAGTGAGSVNGVIAFDAKQHLQRTALTLVNGVVYAAYCGYADTDPYHGWILGYSTSTLSQVQVFNDTPNGSEGGIWMSGSGLSADSNNNLFVAIGNGDFNANVGGTNYGNGLIKMSSSSLSVTDYFTPYNYASLNASDTDFGSGGVLLLPDQPGSAPHLMVNAGKEGRIYLINRDNLGHFNSGFDNVVQTIPGALGGNGCFDTPAYFNNTVYYIGDGDVARAFPLSNGKLATTPSSKGTHAFNFPGASPVISASGSSNAILWALQASSPGVLYAYNPSNLSTELYDSSQAGARDQLPGGIKFTAPTVANGRVYVGTESALCVFGLFSSATTPPAPPSNLVANAISSTQVSLSWSDNSSNETAFKIERSTDNINFVLVNTTGANNPSVIDTGLAANTLYYYRVRATNSAGSSSYSNVASVTTLSGGATSGLVGFWKLDEGSGISVADSSGNNDTGTINGEVTWITGQAGYGTALSFHGQGLAISNVTIPDAPQLRFLASQSFTVSVWASAQTTGTSWASILLKSRDQSFYYGLVVDPNNRWAFAGANKNVEGSIITSGWHLLTGVQDGAAGTRTFYVDGIQVGTGLAQDASGTGVLWLANAASVSQPFNGAIDDVRIYNRALSSAEVQTLANTKWHDADVGAVGQTGSATFLANGTFTINGSGDNIFDTADGFNFVYQQQSGDFEVTARVTAIENTNAYAKAGVMIRESLNANSTFADTVLTPGAGIQFDARTSTAARAIHPANFSGTAPFWVRITRSGNLFTSAASSDGNNWITLGSVTIPMAQSVYLGLCVCARDNSQLNTSSFDNVSVGTASLKPDIVWLKFNDGSGTAAADSSGAGNNFTLTNATWATGKNGIANSAARFDGTAWGSSNASINFGSTKVITICAWLSWDTFANDDHLLAELTTNFNNNDGAFILDPNSSNSTSWQTSMNGGVGTYFSNGFMRPTARVYHHYAIVFNQGANPNVTKVYVDNVLQPLTRNTINKADTPLFPTAVLYLMSRAGNALLGTGTLDDLRIYGRELTASQVTSVFNDPQ